MSRRLKIFSTDICRKSLSSHNYFANIFTDLRFLCIWNTVYPQMKGYSSNHQFTSWLTSQYLYCKIFLLLNLLFFALNLVVVIEILQLFSFDRIAQVAYVYDWSNNILIKLSLLESWEDSCTLS